MHAGAAKAGSLTIVGTGISFVGHVTIEARTCIEQAQKVLCLVSDPLTVDWIRSLNGTAESLVDCYAPGKPRRRSYREMSDRILAHVRRGLDVVVAIYGHPGVMCDPAHWSLRSARRAGYRTLLLPGISAEACLFADLQIDPGDHGSQSYEATDFLNRNPRIDTTSGLVLWQIGAIYQESVPTAVGPEGLAHLIRALARRYHEDHRVIVYEAPTYPTLRPKIRRVALCRLPKAPVSTSSTLYVPPLRRGRGRRT